jgi:tripartite ATP-independent transporter DctM subunit
MEWMDLLPGMMFVAMAVLIFTGYPVAFVLGGIGLAFGLAAVGFELFNFARFGAVYSRIYGGSIENIVLVAIPMFIFMGVMLEKSGIAEDLLYTLQILTRHVPGSLALSVALLGTILAATTGIIGASVVLLTLMALPIMQQRGYSLPLACGTIAASGTLGILIPPSIMLVLMADLMSVPVGTLFLGAIVPGLLLSALYIVFIIVVAIVRPSMAPKLGADVGPKGAALAGMVFKTFLPPVFLITLVLGSIFAGFATPTEAAGVGAFGATLLALFKRRLSLSVLRDVLYRSALTNAMLFGIFVGATCFSYVFTLLGGHAFVEHLINSLGLGPWGVLAMIMLVVFFLGFFIDWIEITLIVLPVFAPIIAKLDFGGHIESVAYVVPWFTILLAVNLQTSFLTPPFGFALFYMKGVAPPGVKIQHIYLGIIPFVLLQLLGVALCIAVPAIVTWLPEAVLG